MSEENKLSVGERAVCVLGGGLRRFFIMIKKSEKTRCIVDAVCRKC